jgi:hypothetical protein
VYDIFTTKFAHSYPLELSLAIVRGFFRISNRTSSNELSSQMNRVYIARRWISLCPIRPRRLSGSSLRSFWGKSLVVPDRRFVSFEGGPLTNKALLSLSYRRQFVVDRRSSRSIEKLGEVYIYTRVIGNCCSTTYSISVLLSLSISKSLSSIRRASSPFASSPFASSPFASSPCLPRVNSSSLLPARRLLSDRNRCSPPRVIARDHAHQSKRWVLREGRSSAWLDRRLG